MLNSDKITEAYCICDDSCKELDRVVAEKSVSSPHYRRCGKRKPKISEAEIITILVCFRTNTYRNFKHYNLCGVLGAMRWGVPQHSVIQPFCHLDGTCVR